MNKVSISLSTLFCLLFMTVSFPRAMMSFLEQGNDYYRKGNYESAAKAYRRAVSNKENPALAWYNLGNALYQNGSPEKAVSCYKSAVVNAPGFIKGWQNLGTLYYDLGDFGACISVLEHLLILDKDNPAPIPVLAAAYKEAEGYGQAAVYMEKAIENNPEFSEAYLMLYDIAIESGDKKEALEWLEKYPQNKSRWYDVNIIRSGLYAETGDTLAALGVLRRTIKKEPEKGLAWRELVSLLHRTGRTYSALLEAERALERVKDPISLVLYSGRLAFKAAYYNKAELFYRVACEYGHADGVTGLSNLLLFYNRHNDEGGIKRIENILNFSKNGSNSE